MGAKGFAIGQCPSPGDSRGRRNRPTPHTQHRNVRRFITDSAAGERVDRGSDQLRAAWSPISVPRQKGGDRREGGFLVELADAKWAKPAIGQWSIKL
jgi:hypothetical protein